MVRSVFMVASLDFLLVITPRPKPRQAPWDIQRSGGVVLPRTLPAKCRMPAPPSLVTQCENGL